MNRNGLFDRLCVLITASLVSCFTLNLASLAAPPAKKFSPTDKGEITFKQMCASCHMDGGNTVQPSKPMRGSTKLATLATFKQYLSTPIGHMPYYPHVINDPHTLQALYKYCKGLEKQPVKQVSSKPESLSFDRQH